MKLLAGSKVLGALLAAAAVGMGVQTYYIVQVHRQLDALGEHAAAAPAPAPRAGGEDQGAGLAPALPFADLQAAETRMRELLDDFYDRFDRRFGEPWLDTHPFFSDGDSFLLGDGGRLVPRVDLQDRGERYELTVDVPGADQADVTVRAEDGVLVIEGSRETATEETVPGSYVRRERQFGHFERRLPLPQDADASTLDTSFEDGVLKVTLEKKT